MVANFYWDMVGAAGPVASGNLSPSLSEGGGKRRRSLHSISPRSRSVENPGKVMYGSMLGEAYRTSMLSHANLSAALSPRWDTADSIQHNSEKA